jgi:hypothetical protein
MSKYSKEQRERIIGTITSQYSGEMLDSVTRKNIMNKINKVLYPNCEITDIADPEKIDQLVMEFSIRYPDGKTELMTIFTGNII